MNTNSRRKTAYKTNSKRLTVSFFDYKWSRVPDWAEVTESTYRKWYLERYGYKNFEGLRKFLADKEFICEAGCGLARDSKMFAKANPRAVIFAVDKSKEALQIAKKALHNFPNCKVVAADITHLSIKEKFDFISCDQVIHHTPDPGATLCHLFEKLRSGGVLNFSVCKKKNEYRELVDDAIMKRAKKMSPKDLWRFAEEVTRFAKVLFDLQIKQVKFEGKQYENLQRFVHNHVFRAWYRPDIPFELSVSSNYDWFCGNPRFSAAEVRGHMLSRLSSYKVLRFFEDDAVISVSLQAK